MSSKYYSFQNQVKAYFNPFGQGFIKSLITSFSNFNEHLKRALIFFSFLMMVNISKGHLFCRQCLHDLQFKKTRYFSVRSSHQTLPSQPELTSAVSLRKQGTCADIIYKMNGLQFERIMMKVLVKNVSLNINFQCAITLN